MTPVPGAGLMGRTIAILSDMPGQPQRRLFCGDEIAVESGVIDTVFDAGLNAFSLHASQFDDAGIDRLLTDRPQGIAVTCRPEDPARQHALLERLSQGGLPVVVYGDTSELASFDRVASDHRSGAYELVRMLARRGCRKILRLWVPAPTVPWLKAHDAGYEQAARECGLHVLPAVHVRDMPKRVAGSRPVFDLRVRHLAGFLAEHLSAPGRVDAIMVSTDCEIFPLAAACRLFGRKPGQDIQIAGYDNYWRQAFERTWEDTSPCATVDKRNHQIGESLGRLLLERIAERLPNAPQCRMIPQEVLATPL